MRVRRSCFWHRPADYAFPALTGLTGRLILQEYCGAFLQNASELRNLLLSIAQTATAVCVLASYSRVTEGARGQQGYLGMNRSWRICQ
jgi:hypothetical protein